MNITSFHRRNLPHFYQPDTTYFITFRIKGSIPLEKLLSLNNSTNKKRIMNKSAKHKINEKYFYEYDRLIHKYNLKYHLNNSALADLVKNELDKYNGKDYKIICYSIMPNHVHIIFHLHENARTVGKIMQSKKRVSSFNINKYLGRKGNFWQAESYDHIVRNQAELEILIEYTLLNPVKAGIVDEWEEFKYNYLSDSW